ncbi:hypothetical protein HGB07_00500 [Candidatus Roizmanbacteria bacterium]|nr:hypothetical protein [Candidatus Roizmanbacteria bacterium]
MKLFSMFGKKAPEQAPVYFGLLLREERIHGFIYEISTSQCTVLAEKKVNLTNGWDNLTEEVDQLLYELESESKREVKQVIYFVYSYVIDEQKGSIQKEYLDVFKRLSRELELKPLGYIESREAVAAHLHEHDSSPVNAVLVELDATHIGVSVYKAGKCILLRSTARTERIVDDIETILESGNVDTLLPSRIVLYDSIDIKGQADDIHTHRWPESLFVQIPRVEVLTEHQLSAGLKKLFCSQVQELNLSVSVDVPPSQPEAEASSETDKSSHDDTKLTPQRAEQVFEETEELGFVINKDIQEEKANEETAVAPVHHVEPAKEHKKIKIPFKIPSIKVPQLLLFSGGKNKKRFILLLGAILGIILISGIACYQLIFYKVRLLVYMPSQHISKELNMTGYLNGNGGDITIEAATTSAEISQQLASSGQKEVGEKAKGRVSIYSYDDSPKTFSKGSIITIDNLSYALDNDVTVASASEVIIDQGRVKQPGKNTGTVTAADIGSQYNLDKGKRLKIGDLSSSTYYAINDESFSGGLKKEVRTVSKKDMDDLANAVLEAAQKAKSTEGGSVIETATIPALTQYTLGTSNYSKELGEQTDSLTLTATVNTTQYSYRVSQLKEAIVSLVQGDVPDGYKLTTDQIMYSVRSAEKKADKVALVLSIDANLQKEINTSGIAAQVAGKQIGSLQDLLKNQVGAEGCKVENKAFSIGFINVLMPFLSQNIEVVRASQ